MKHTTVLATSLAPIAWGTTYIVSTELLPADRPLLAGLLRALPAGIALALMTRTRPTGTWWLKAAVLGALNIGGFFALLFYAAFRLPGGVAATLGAVQPLIAVGLAATLLGERIQVWAHSADYAFDLQWRDGLSDMTPHPAGQVEGGREVSALDSTRSEFTYDINLSLNGPTKFLGFVLRPILSRKLRADLERFRTLVEDDETATNTPATYSTSLP